MNTLVTMPFDFAMPEFSEHLKEMIPYTQFVFASLEDEFADAVWMLDMATAVAITMAARKSPPFSPIGAVGEPTCLA